MQSGGKEGHFPYLNALANHPAAVRDNAHYLINLF